MPGIVTADGLVVPLTMRKRTPNISLRAIEEAEGDQERAADKVGVRVLNGTLVLVASITFGTPEVSMMPARVAKVKAETENDGGDEEPPMDEGVQLEEEDPWEEPTDEQKRVGPKRPKGFVASANDTRDWQVAEASTSGGEVQDEHDEQDE